MRGGIAVVTLALAACGAGNGEGLDQSGQPAPSCGTSAGAAPFAPTLDSIQTNVFNVNCAVPGCHGGAAAQQGLRLDAGFSAGNLINVASPRDPNLIRVIPGNPDGSFIVRKLEGTQTLGDRMPDFGPYLPQSTIDVIRQWIQDGAPTQ
ncbi:MAG TPA: hypothetical protein VE008_02265 [Burkholderiales bacterium]|nr:hypothetical protein [Burkholderiales bacterium]